MSKSCLKIKRKKLINSREPAKISLKISMRRKEFDSMLINVSSLPLSKLSCNPLHLQEMLWMVLVVPLALKKSKVPLAGA